MLVAYSLPDCLPFPAEWNRNSPVLGKFNRTSPNIPVQDTDLKGCSCSILLKKFNRMDDGVYTINFKQYCSRHGYWITDRRVTESKAYLPRGAQWLDNYDDGWNTWSLRPILRFTSQQTQNFVRRVLWSEWNFIQWRGVTLVLGAPCWQNFSTPLEPFGTPSRGLVDYYFSW